MVKAQGKKRRVKTTIRKGKKKWFTAIAPELFNKQELGDVTAFEPKNLLGRVLNINMMAITRSPRDQSKKMIFKIIDVKGDQAITEAKKYYLLDSYVQRISRRYKSRFNPVFYVKTKDDQKLKVKGYILLNNKVPVTLRSKLIAGVKESLTKKFAKQPISLAFDPMFLAKISDEVKKEHKKLYPVSKVYIWKLSRV